MRRVKKMQIFIDVLVIGGCRGARCRAGLGRCAVVGPTLAGCGASGSLVLRMFVSASTGSIGSCCA